MILNAILTIKKQEIGGQNVEAGLTSRAEKTLHQRNEWRQRFDRGTLMASPKFQIRLLQFKLLGKTFSREFIKTPFFANSENKNRNFAVIFTVYFTEKSL